MKKLLIPGVIVLAAIIVFTIARKSNPPNEGIRVGFAGTLSGPASFVGTEIKRGAEIAISEINAGGGVNGKMLELIVRDDEHEPSKTVTLYRELIERENVVAMLGAANSASMLAVAPLVNDRLQVPVICPATDATEITENEAQREGRKNYLFRVGMYGSGQANFMADTAVKKFGHKRIGLLTWTGGWGVTGRGELVRRLKELGITPVSDETYDSDDTDMTPQILRLRKAGAESILNYGLVRDNAFVMKTREVIGDTTPYISAWGVSGPAFWDACDDAAEGVCVSTTITTHGPQSPRRIKFMESYRSRYETDMIAPVFAVGAYDAVYLFKHAIEKGDAAPSSIRDELEKIDAFDGLIKRFDRTVFTADRHNAISESDMILGRWTNGKLLKVDFTEREPTVTKEDGATFRLDTETMGLRPTLPDEQPEEPQQRATQKAGDGILATP